MKHIAYVGVGFVLSMGMLNLPAVAQNQASSQNQSSSDSLGNYARHVRKDNGQAKAKPKVFDNDNIPTQDTLSIIGPEPPAATSAPTSEASAATPATSDTKPASGEGKSTADTKVEPKIAAKTPEGEAAERQAANKVWQDKLAAQKDQIDLNQRELDVLQREYQLRAAAIYADAGNRMRNSGDWDKQDAQYKQQIADKQKALDDAKQKLDDMQEEARKAGVPASARESQ
jgi:hypothetical protein